MLIFVLSTAMVYNKVSWYAIPAGNARKEYVLSQENKLKLLEMQADSWRKISTPTLMVEMAINEVERRIAVDDLMSVINRQKQVISKFIVSVSYVRED